MIIQTEQLSKRYGRHDALRGLSLSVPEGSAFALIGANGAGKTTTIKLLMNILAPSEGSATLLGVDSRRLSPRELTRIGYVSENQDMPLRLTVGEYLDYLRPFYPGWDHSLERDILARMRLPLERKIGDLSHGMRMKMALVCALPFRPALLVLDEPFSGLDPLVRDEFMTGLLGQAGEMTILISSHELNEIEGVATHVGFIDGGQLLFQQSMEELTGRLRSVRVTLGSSEPAGTELPETWLQVNRVGNVLSFVDTQFSQDELSSRIAATLRGVRNIDVQPISLRSIFTTLARAGQGQEVRS
ncbi:MAG: ABC transporter ATP-binding protein [Steroidobacteraceae bacterium]